MSFKLQKFFYQKSNLMKEAQSSDFELLNNKTRNGISLPFSPKLHQRGDKVVVNGAKQSLLAILRRYTCQCQKHTLDKMTLKFLTSSKITASYDILVWMLIFLRKNCVIELYCKILNQYILKMQKKRDENQNHQSQKYIKTKKQTLQKFIQSAEIMMVDSMNLAVIEKSVGALYSKGKSRDNAFKKIKVYLSKINFQYCLQFQQSNCSFKLKDQYSESMNIIEQDQKQNNEISNFSSDNSEEQIQQIIPQEKTPEDIFGGLLGDYTNMSYRQSSKRQLNSYDLFEELIREDESAYSLQSDYLVGYE